MNKISISKKCWTNSKWGCNFSKQQSFSLSIFDMLSCYFLLNKAFNVFINFCFFILFLWKWSWLVKLLYTNSFLSFWTRLWMVHLKTATTWKHQIVVKSMCVCVCVSLQGGNDHEIYCDPRTIGHTVSCPEETQQLCQQLFFAWCLTDDYFFWTQEKPVNHL